MKIAVVLAGVLEAGKRTKSVLDEADLVIAADGGAERLRDIGIAPDILIGDLDSLPDGHVRELQARDAEILNFPERKDQTDAELALEEAVRRGASQITMLGALGGSRIDHEIANILLLTDKSYRDRDVRLLSEAAEAWAVGGGSQSFAAEIGDVVSLIPLSETADGVTTAGLEWELDGAALSLGRSRTMSNVAVDATVSVSVESGVLLVMHQFGERSK